MLSFKTVDEFLAVRFSDLKYAGNTTDLILSETNEEYVLADHVKIPVYRLKNLVTAWVNGKPLKRGEANFVPTEFHVLHAMATCLISLAYACAALCPVTNSEAAITHFENIIIDFVSSFIRNKLLRETVMDKLHEMPEWNEAMEIFVNKAEAPDEMTVQPSFPKNGRTDIASYDLIHVNKRMYPTKKVEVETKEEASELNNPKLFKRVYQAAHKKAEIQKSYIYEYLKVINVIDEEKSVITMSATACHVKLAESNDILETGKAVCHISLATIRDIFKETGFKVITRRGCNGFKKKESTNELVRLNDNSINSCSDIDLRTSGGNEHDRSDCDSSSDLSNSQSSPVVMEECTDHLEEDKSMVSSEEVSCEVAESRIDQGSTVGDCETAEPVAEEEREDSQPVDPIEAQAEDLIFKYMDESYEFWWHTKWILQRGNSNHYKLTESLLKRDGVYSFKLLDKIMYLVKYCLTSEDVPENPPKRDAA